jgi:hypothetical protein
LLFFTWAGCTADPPDIKYGNGFRPIINGTPDNSQAHMAVVFINHQSTGAACTGTLITNRIVLTAGHCVYGASQNGFLVYFGSDYNTDPGQIRFSSRTEVHPNYGSGGGGGVPVNDIACIELSNNAPAGITPIPHLPQGYSLTASDVGDPLTFVGFGITPADNSRKLYYVGSLGRVCDGPGSCTYGGAFVVPRAIAYSVQSGGPCSGDSGGPAFVDRSGQEYVAGITSYGDQGCDYYGVSAKVDRYQTFIEDCIGSTVPEDCMNGTDDDNDGLVDCIDPECADEPFCSGEEACENPGVLTCGNSVTGNTTGGSQRFLNYSCFGDTMIGPEVAYQISATIGQQVTVTMTPTSGQDLDLFLVPAMSTTCAPDSCLGSSTNNGTATEALTFTVPSGGTYAIVDSFGAQGGTFQLSLDCGSISELCDNGSDDDNDGDIDCADPDCSTAINCQSTVESCANGVDDDGDNMIDCADPDCVGASNCNSGNNEFCNNNIDDDGDGYVDCADSECAPLAGCQAQTEICNDGQDNDSDGLIDCIDPDCRESSNICANIPPEVCNNQTDDDGDTFIDCADPDCRDAANCVGRPPEICYGNDDEDGDGLADCADPDCFAYQPCQSGPKAEGGCECSALPAGAPLLSCGF